MWLSSTWSAYQSSTSKIIKLLRIFKDASESSINYLWLICIHPSSVLFTCVYMHVCCFSPKLCKCRNWIWNISKRGYNEDKYKIFKLGINTCSVNGTYMCPLLQMLTGSVKYFSFTSKRTQHDMTWPNPWLPDTFYSHNLTSLMNYSLPIFQLSCFF